MQLAGGAAVHTLGAGGTADRAAGGPPRLERRKLQRRCFGQQRHLRVHRARPRRCMHGSRPLTRGRCRADAMGTVVCCADARVDTPPAPWRCEPGCSCLLGTVQMDYRSADGRCESCSCVPAKMAPLLDGVLAPCPFGGARCVMLPEAVPPAQEEGADGGGWMDDETAVVAAGACVVAAAVAIAAVITARKAWGANSSTLDHVDIMPPHEAEAPVWDTGPSPPRPQALFTNGRVLRPSSAAAVLTPAAG